MDRPGHWLFSVESANNLAGVLGGADADPRDVIRFDSGAGTYSFFFCGATVGIPDGVNLDAAYLDDGDNGTLIVSFDVPTTLGAMTFDPADLVRFRKTVAGCGGWALDGGQPGLRRVRGRHRHSDFGQHARRGACRALRIFSLDVPATLGPPGAVTYLPGQIVAWNGAAFSVYEPLAGWPLSDTVDGLSTQGNPGIVPATLLVNKTVFPQLDTSDVIISWSASCSEGASNYGIYEGTIGTWYSHTLGRLSRTAAAPLTEQITPARGLALLPRRAEQPDDGGLLRSETNGTRRVRRTARRGCAVRCGADGDRLPVMAPVIGDRNREGPVPNLYCRHGRPTSSRHPARALEARRHARHAPPPQALRSHRCPGR